MPSKHVVLTDVENETWIESFSLTADDGLELDGATDWAITKRMLRGGLSAGVDVVEVNNGAFAISILPTRGMGLWRGRLGEVPLGWNSPVKHPVNPSFVNLTDRNGLGWLTGFNELLCRCGLASHGAPGKDVVKDNNGNPIETELTLHGKIANTPAHYVDVQVSTDHGGTLSVTGIVDEAMLFGPCLRLKSTLETSAGSNQITITDEVTNISAQPAELELLYHTNIGEPFLEAGSRFVAPISRVVPRDPHAAADIGDFATYLPPTVGYVEQCYFVDLANDADGESLVLLRNSSGEKGVSLRFARKQLPCFTIWKNTQAGADGYVTGLEPSTDFPNLKTFEREQGRVVQLKAGQSYSTRLAIAVHIGTDQVAAVEQRIAEIQGDTSPEIIEQPDSRYAPA